MKNFLWLFGLIFITPVLSQTASTLKIVIIRHGEKPDDGDNLTCKGLNRAMQLPKVLVDKFGKPSRIYVPSVDPKKSASHARMFETATPLAVKYNLEINAKYGVEDYADLAQDLKARKGTELVVWEHKALDNLLRALGMKTKGLKWDDADFDSIWIVDFKTGEAKLSFDKEGLKPSETCQF